jgi:hypothetical protein
MSDRNGSPERAVQTSLLPDLAPDRPLGRITGSVQTGSNADLIAAIAPLYLTGAVCDVTYGLGGWWRRFTPSPFVAHDIDPAKGDGVDFTRLPEPDDTYDAVTFDPPYIAPGSVPTSTVPDFHARFGLVSGSERGHVDLRRLIAAGLLECARVSRGFVLVKCMDAVTSKDLDLGHARVLDLGRAIGLDFHDLIVHHTGSGPGGHNIFTPTRARRHHSYLIVFRNGRAR